MSIAMIPAPKNIVLSQGVCQNASVHAICCPDMGPQAYRIQICQDGIEIAYGDEEGHIYACTTLDQIRLQSGSALPCGVIEDRPALGHRSFHIDCARHFFPLEQLKKMVDMASYFKLNRFHWHFSDDQGWRIECKAFPKLHEIGAFRQGDHFGAYSSDAYEGGFYTREEVKELVSFCRERGIEIVPEVDIPGHVTAILAAYPNLSCSGKAVQVQTKPGIFHDILCAGKEEVYAFLERLMDDLLELFPGEYFHIGGDECPKNAWKECPYCKAKLEAEGLENYQQLQGYMNNRVAVYLAKHGRKAICWNEAANGDNLDANIILQYWAEDKDNHVAKHVAKGGKVILSPMMNAYCDYPHAFISTRSLHSLDTAPENLPEGSVIGTECLVWTEYIRDGAQLESRAWPRFCASAEAGWCGADKPEYDGFCDRLRVLFPIFTEKGVNATLETMWSPTMEEGMEELLSFKRNIRQAVKDEYRKAQEEV